MKIKSLLLGSSAALVAVSSAQAADAIVIEPEPVEYVRVCDTYGSGFFYIPGTETCMRISGYVRSTYSSVHESYDLTQNGADVDTVFIRGHYAAELQSGGREITVQGAPTSVLVSRNIFNTQQFITQHRDGEFHSWGVRGRLNIDVRNETEWGTLRSQLRFQGGDTNTQDAAVAIDRALISVGGFRLGYSDSFTTTHHGYGYHRAINDGFYNYDQAIFFDYTWAGNGFSVTAGVQDSESGNSAFAGAFVNNVFTAGANVGQFSNSGGMADFYAGVSYSANWGNIAISAIHDSRAWGEGNANFNGAPIITDTWVYGEGAWTWRGSVDLNLSEYFSGGALRGWYASSESPHNNTIGGTRNGGNAFNFLPADHEWGVSLQASLGSNLNGYIGYSAVSGNDEKSLISYDAWDASIGLVWAPITGLTIQTEYNVGRSEVEANAGAYDVGGGVTFVRGVEQSIERDISRATIRITRSW